MPMIQVAGFSRKLSVLSLPKKKVPVEGFLFFLFSKSLNQIRTGPLENLINFISTIDDMLDDLRKICHYNGSSDDNVIKSILTEVNQKKRPLLLHFATTELAYDAANCLKRSSDTVVPENQDKIIILINRVRYINRNHTVNIDPNTTVNSCRHINEEGKEKDLTWLRVLDNTAKKAKGG
ncbi:hypothetical protein BCV71DRAFT_254909 [Rhizopus microsporus]|uniref:Uncharacterized protein n=1 Tax=Rhizopus microsporus TaxID=58291 RepID=A0A1X0S5B6_RHIZD|nr:hypothetical protein BCV71DRAFT_254909 [Rhizopus microsporus]